MLSNEYFVAKFRFDTAENEPAINLQKFANFANLNPLTVTQAAADGVLGGGVVGEELGVVGLLGGPSGRRRVEEELGLARLRCAQPPALLGVGDAVREGDEAGRRGARDGAVDARAHERDGGLRSTSNLS